MFCLIPLGAASPLSMSNRLDGSEIDIREKIFWAVAAPVKHSSAVHQKDIKE
jgi:hypothetical protein